MEAQLRNMLILPKSSLVSQNGWSILKLEGFSF